MMKRAIGATFLLFFTASTIVATSQRTASWASTIVGHSGSQGSVTRAASPRLPQVRIHESPFLGLQEVTTFALAATCLSATCPLSVSLFSDPRRSTLSRAPPPLL